MQILVAPQEMKGTLTARDTAEVIARGVRDAGFGDDVLEVVPIADGGPGTLDALVDARGGRRVAAKARDPLGREVDAFFGMLPSDVAIVEMAQASGLWRLRGDERDPWRASTFGTGELIRGALDAGARQVVIGAGGSATNDGGMGALRALGARFLDGHGHECIELAQVARADLSGLDPRLAKVRVEVATDVTNPLLGPQGATFVFGPQKGLTADACAELDAAMARFASVLERAAGRDVTTLQGAGAAGGLAFGLCCALGATIRSGFDAVAEALSLDERIPRADIVLTAEGRVDAQTGFGKGPAALARRAWTFGVPTVVFTGSVAADADTSPFVRAVALNPAQVPSPAEARVMLLSAVRQWRLAQADEDRARAREGRRGT